MARPIIPNDLAGLPGLRRAAMAEILAAQPKTVREALAIPDVGRRATRHLLALGLLADPEHLQDRSMAAVMRVERAGGRNPGKRTQR
ncbi:MAG: hypothetical protein HYS27_02390 [Deltaproteobacteria bacterium]|nr:hypothetical protein [Deltaproteobacteria bacterium]